MNIRKDPAEGFNYIVLGANGVGKSTLITKYIAHISPDKKLDDEKLAIYPETIQLKQFGHSIKLKIYERMSIEMIDQNMLFSGYIVMFSLSDENSFKFAEKELMKLINFQQKNCKSNVILLGNKITNTDFKIKQSQIKSLSKSKSLNIIYVEADVKHKSSEVFYRLIKMTSNINELDGNLNAENPQISGEIKKQYLSNIVDLTNSLIDSYFNKNTNYVLENIQLLKQNFSDAISRYYETKNLQEVVDHYDKNIDMIYVKWFTHHSKNVSKKLKYIIELYDPGLLEKTRMIDQLILVNQHLINHLIKGGVIDISKNGIIDINKKHYEAMSLYAKQINALQFSPEEKDGLFIKRQNDIFIKKHNFAKALLESLSADVCEPQDNLNILSNHLNFLSNHLTTLKLHFMSRDISDANIKKLKAHQSEIILDLLSVYINVKQFNDVRMDYKSSFHHVKLFKLSAKVDIVEYYRAAVKHLKHPLHNAQGEKMLTHILQINKEQIEHILGDDNNSKVKQM